MYLDFHKFHEFDLRYNPAHMFLVNAYGDLINFRGAINFFETQIENHLDLSVPEKKDPLIIPFVNDKENYKSIIYSSMIISIYSLMENHLLKLCQLHKLFYPNDPDIKDHKGKSGVKKFAQYLNKTAGCTDVYGSRWGEIDAWRKVRNCLIHDNGIPKPDDAEIFTSILNLVVVKKEYVIINGEDCRKYIDLIEDYLFFLTHQLKFDIRERQKKT
ncbi:hypothetical protein [Paenibacillus silviterrae]|jgi:hypothetical protein|uniref:hypothetical protein n=1 Tax=Paenibacillus silviterrae TaxID=3242194 RepID=UPI002542BE1F|nr:hypothetical protein [Paenibacillus chinjuensis]